MQNKEWFFTWFSVTVRENVKVKFDLELCRFGVWVYMVIRMMEYVECCRRHA